MHKDKIRNNSFQRLQIYLILTVCGIIILFAIFMSEVILKRSEAAIKLRVSELIAANTHQLQMNVDSYLEKAEYTSSLIFSNEDYYTYDATDNSISEYEHVKKRKEISDRIVDIGVMQNFSDFGIVYRNDQTVGWISKGTQSLFKENDMFTTFESSITNNRTEDGWCFGIKGNIDRFYYIKRLNDNAVLIASFYGRELNSVFELPEELSDVTISLADEKKAVLYSSDKENIGKSLSPELTEILHDRTNIIAMNDTILVTVNACKNNWLVVCSVPMESVLKESMQLKEFVIIFTIIMVIVFILVAIFVLSKLSNPFSGFVNELANKAEHDALSGLLNKASYMNKVTEMLEKQDKNRFTAFMMFDVDNFKQINDRLGHAHGDEVIRRMGKLLKQFEDPRTLVGRIGGDEFSATKEFSNVSFDNVTEYMNNMLNQILEQFASEFAEEHDKCNVSLSAGIVIGIGNRDTYEILFKQADTALYVSKRSGKNQYTWYREGMQNEK